MPRTGSKTKYQRLQRWMNLMLSRSCLRYEKTGINILCRDVLRVRAADGRGSLPSIAVDNWGAAGLSFAYGVARAV